MIANATDYASVITQAFPSRRDGVTAGTNAGAVTLTSADTTASSDVAITGLASTDNKDAFNVVDINISSASDSTLDTYIAGIESMSASVIQSAADLGAIKIRAATQTDFISSLMDAIDRGVGSLVDADMTKESTRLQALQVQQQLGIQALSIANSNSQNILSLFK